MFCLCFWCIKTEKNCKPKLKLETLQDLKGILDSGNDLPFPDGLLINGQGWNGNRFTVDQGKNFRVAKQRAKIADKYFIFVKTETELYRTSFM